MFFCLQVDRPITGGAYHDNLLLIDPWVTFAQNTQNEKTAIQSAKRFIEHCGGRMVAILNFF